MSLSLGQDAPTTDWVTSVVVSRATSRLSVVARGCSVCVVGVVTATVDGMVVVVVVALALSEGVACAPIGVVVSGASGACGMTRGTRGTELISVSALHCSFRTGAPEPIVVPRVACGIGLIPISAPVCSFCAAAARQVSGLSARVRPELISVLTWGCKLRVVESAFCWGGKPTSAKSTAGSTG